MTDNVFRVADISSRRRKPRPRAETEDDGVAQDGSTAGQEVWRPTVEAQPEENADEYYDGYEEPSSAIQSEIISSAMNEVAGILSQATRDAEARKEEILAKAYFDAEQIRKKADEEGRRQGFITVMSETKEIATSVEQAVARFEGERAGFETEYEDQIRWLAFEIAAKVLAKKVSQDDTEMLAMVEKAVRSVQNEPWVRVEVAQEMTRLIGRLMELFDSQANIEVNAVPAEPGSVKIETPSGVVDASLRTQLENLRQYFESSGT